MSSVHQCAECGKTPDQVQFRLNGSHKLRKFCEPCGKLRVQRLKGSATQPVTPPIDDTPRIADGYAMMPYGATQIAWDTDGGMMSLTDLHRAVGSPANKEPAQWLRQDQAKEYIEACTRRGLIMVSNHNYSRPGAHGGTWHAKIVGLAYAQYLNADLYVACNQFILEKWGQVSHSTSLSSELLTNIVEQNNAILRALGVLPRLEGKQDATLDIVGGIASDVSGAEKITIRQDRRGRIYIGLLTDPNMTALVRRDLRDVPNDALLVFIGQTKPGEGQEKLRIKEYGGKIGKVRTTDYEVLATFDTDNPDGCEMLLLSNPQSGAVRAIVADTRKRSLSFHLATPAAMAGYRALTKDYYAVTELQAAWVLSSRGPLQTPLWGSL